VFNSKQTKNEKANSLFEYLQFKPDFSHKNCVSWEPNKTLCSISRL